MSYPEVNMTEPQESKQPSMSPEAQQLLENTAQYEEEYARAFAESFPKFTEEQVEKAMALAHRFALERARAERKLQEEGGKDALTGLDNRNRFAEDARIEIANAIRNKQGFAIFFVDIDHFKQVNDESLHSTGDEVLRQVTQQLSSGSRKGDRLARLGGEEIIGLVKVSEDKAINAAERWRKNLEEKNISYVTKSGETKKVTVSIGVALFNPVTDIGDSNINDVYINNRLNEVVRLADMAMYCAKENGRNRIGVVKSDGSFATLDPHQTKNGNKLTARLTPNQPPVAVYFRLAA